MQEIDQLDRNCVQTTCECVYVLLFIFLLYHLRYALLQKCWEADVDHRICFIDIVAELSDNDMHYSGRIE